MGFRLKSTLDGFEFRGTQSGVSTSTGKPWMSVILEDPDDCSQVNCRVPSEMQQFIGGLGLTKGQLVTCEVVGIAGDGYSYINLLSLPLLYESDSVTGVDF